MPLFLPMVLSVELMVSTLPCAVHSTATQTGRVNTHGRETADGSEAAADAFTCSSDPNQHGGRVEGPGVGLDEHSDVATGGKNQDKTHE